jgi:hypothetical protein
MTLASALLIAGKVTFGLVGFTLGLRLLTAPDPNQRRGVQALCAGMIFVGGAGLAMIALVPMMEAGTMRDIVGLIGEVTMRAGVMGLCVFTWFVFRRESVLGKLLCGASSVFLFASLAWEYASQTSMIAYDVSLPSAMSTQISIAIPFFWSTLETSTHWSRSQRQVSLGLAEPIVAHRFALWGIVSGGFVWICLAACLAGQARGAGMELLSDVATSSRGIAYFAISAIVALGMFMPESYRNRINQRA